MQGNQRQTHYAYIAGIMDADGCFMILKHKRKTLNGKTQRSLDFPKNLENWSITYLPVVKICMIEPEAIQKIMKLGFGNMHIDGARKSRPNSKPIYHWYMRKKENVAKFIKKIMPYLEVKKNRAKHLLKFCEHLMDLKNPCYKGLSNKELNYREQFYLKMRELNGNKVAATTESLRPERVCDSLDLQETVRGNSEVFSPPEMVCRI